MAQKLSEQLQKLQEENAANQKQLAIDLEARHAEEIIKLRDESSQREKQIEAKLRQDHDSRFRNLLMAFMEARAGRNRIIVAVSWSAVGILAVMIFTGFVTGDLSTVLVLAALAGFSVAILLAEKNSKWNEEHLQRAIDDTGISNVMMDYAYGRSVGFLFFGLISTVFLCLAGFINPLGKADVRLPATPVSSVKATSPESASASASVLEKMPVTAKDALEASAIFSKSLPDTSGFKAKITGNGGNFAGGELRK
ncbi:MAG: hypothetical protein HQL12_06095 [Candidatus Omnitrophica bacterium]|nr:hypothetical protein [Candidatus Omnitrophota bacterium]